MQKHPDADQSSIFKNIGGSLDNSVRSESAKGEGALPYLACLGNKVGESEEAGGQPKLSVEENSEEQLKGKGARETALENPRRCFFCNKQCAGIKKCLDHMRRQHSFVILDVDCLVDLKGLQAYIAERIQIGQLCLFCSKSFKDPTACQQHMIDKGHCMMNMEDEDEYVDFYDFSKTYENHPLLVKKEEIAGQDEAIDEKQEEEDERSDGSWSYCDEEDLGSDEEVGPEQVQLQAPGTADAAKSSQSFSIVDGPQAESSSASFQIVDGKQSKAGGDGSTTQDFGIESLSSIQGKDDGPESSSQHSFTKKASSAKTGKTREEVFLGLDIKRAELLPSGEVRLGNGKIIGTRKWRYLYKQRPRPIDDREAVIINKVALEYRKLRALQNGGVGDSLFQADQRLERKERTRAQQIESKRAFAKGMQANSLQHHFKDPTAHLQ